MTIKILTIGELKRPLPDGKYILTISRMPNEGEGELYDAKGEIRRCFREEYRLYKTKGRLLRAKERISKKYWADFIQVNNLLCPN